ncbi:MAG: APC family permease [Actinomycetota bacterium]|nr:APC family permease [Actinomycetota bacterium]
MATSTTPTGPSGTSSVVKRLLVGRAVPSSRLEHTLLPKWLALPVFSSDALSSVAYASEEILRVLLIASVGTAYLVGPIALAIATLMIIVVASYRQTVRAYPSGGGAYIVSKANLGQTPGLIAASALLVDYMMTVVVSIVAGVIAIISALPGLSPYRVFLSVGFVLLITFANLRGVKEAGTIFAVPTYCFIISIVFMVVTGLVKCATSGCPTSVLPPGIHPEPDLAKTAGAVGLFVILRAFSSGATALTGVEAISNGVPAFRRPQAKNAAETLAIMGAISVAMFLGISYLTTHISGITISADRSVVSQIAGAVFGNSSLPFYLVQAFTAAILVLAANTAYQDFPRLASILARDRFMPGQFMNRGDRLVFSNGVVGLAAGAIVVIVAFNADLNKLIQLYVVGVFTSFTFSQTGMVRHWLAERHKGATAAKGWQTSIVINAIGAVTTGVVLVVVTATKFVHGAWLSILVMAAIVPTFKSIHKHYLSVQAQLRRGSVEPGRVGTNRVVLLVTEISSATAEALGYVRSCRPPELHALYPGGDVVPPDLQERWRAFAGGGVDLEPLPRGKENLLESVRTYLAGIRRDPDDFITVVVPEVVEEGLPVYLLRKRPLVRLKAGLLREPNVVVADVPFWHERGEPWPAAVRPLIPQRTVTLVFVSGVHDATIRAVNYAQSLGASETRAIYFDLDPDTAHRVEQGWFDKGLRIPLDIVEAPFRDLTGPIVREVRRFTARPDTLVTVVLPEFVVEKWRHLLLHNQNALFVKRLLLFEERTVLSSVPYVLHDDAPAEDRQPTGH